MLKRHLTHIFVARHNHTRYPEEDDIRTRYQVSRRVVILNLFVVRVLNSVEQTNRPQPAAEPRVQSTFVLHVIAFRLRLAHDNLIRRIILQTGLRQQIRIVVRRNTVTPPQLTRDAPILDVLQPVTVRVLVFGRIELDLVLHHRRQRDIGKVLHLNKPLQTQPRLNWHVRTLAVTYFIVVVLDFLHEIQRFQVFHNLLAAIETVHAVVLAHVLLQFRLHRIHI